MTYTWTMNTYTILMSTLLETLPFSIPERFHWVAQDSNGAWWGYTVEPHRSDFGWYENEVGESERLGETAPVNWEQSLLKVEKAAK